ncbi:butyrate kinase [Tissierella creatinini]|nr:butyrate kinase [Tissierella creatinini]TJX66049.1 butyrate kinase [Soehngenia saccharolytica]
MFKQLIINPGSTSTKIAIFYDENVYFELTLRHSVEELKGFNNVYNQLNFRKNLILKELQERGIDLKTLDCVVGRGGLLKPIESGIYEVNELMIQDLKDSHLGEHASNLGALLANEITKDLNIKSYIVDPVVVDELQDVARISGLKEIPRISIFHALNQNAIARKHAALRNRRYEDMNLIVAHLGGGISVGAHRKGRVVDCANALNGDGPFSPERSGGLPVGDLIKLCYSGKYTYDELKKKLTGQGGLVSYLNTNDAREVVARINKGDEYARLIYYAMAYQTAKEIGAMAVVLHGQVDGILLTGGIAYDSMFTDWISEKVKFISEIYLYPGDDELRALAEGGLIILRGEEKPKIYE